ncbi:MAG: 16S rRNA (uracil(1498)-N(3))-methyltransferase [Lachnospiraceae bacterium]|nr:16S rRNA (uracil(1498)-N(3))-methyltransferase [Lachnospiraceae bacterium]
MYHFFAEPSDISGHDINLRGDNYNHIKNVLRMKPGEVISVSDGNSGNEYRCHIEGFTDDAVHCRLDFIKEAGTELPVRVYLFQSLPKGDKMELVIQKAVELGVTEVIPVASKRCVVKLDDKKAAAKVMRWNSIANAAAKQSMRQTVPEVREVMDFDEALSYAEKCDVKLIPYELAEDFSRTRQIISGLKPGCSVAVFIGPEGGYAEEEIAGAQAKGVIPITLGRRILRTETAAMVVLSWLVYELES